MLNCKTISICNQKGGVTKTSTTVNLGIGLAMQGKKVLLVDADPQGDLTTCLGWQNTDNLGITLATKLSDVMNETMNDPMEGILHHEEGVDLIPANLELSAMEFNLMNAMSRETTLRNYLSQVKENYEYVLIDCMPSLGMITLNALSASDEVIIPVQAQYLPAKGMTQLVSTISKVKKYIKGKMIFSGQIKRNYAHKERSYVEYDEYNTNRPENKLIKATLQYLYKITYSAKNKSDIKTLLNHFCEVSISDDYKGDFDKVVIERNTRDYTTALTWCKVFLMGKSFTSFSGSEIAFVLLFPMETLFESYIAVQLRKVLNTSEYALSAQDRTYHLFDEPNRKFLIKPDIVIRQKEPKNVFIMDTKWKVLSDGKNNFGISQSDMYQMYAYQKKYGAENVTLLYPLTEKISEGSGIEFQSKDNVTVRVRFVDLFNLKESLNSIAEEIADKYLNEGEAE